MTITVNGTLHTFDHDMTVSELLRLLQITTDGVAVAINASVAPKKQHPSTYVHDGDVVEIIRAVAGG